VEPTYWISHEIIGGVNLEPDDIWRVESFSRLQKLAGRSRPVLVNE
jgi:hypothetical protein